MEHKLPIGVTVLGVVVVILGVILGWVVMPKVIDGKIADETQLKDGSESLDKWANIPYPIYLSFYVFNVTNPDEVEAGGKPKLQETGPYVYSQNRTKVDLTHNDTNDPARTIQYKERKTYTFEKELSFRIDEVTGERIENTEDDLVNIVNLPFVAVVHGVRQKLKDLVGLVANIFLRTERFIRRGVKVGELLFEGFDVSLYTNNAVLALALPEEFDNGTFGLYKGENGTDSLEFDIYTGVGGHEEFGIIKKYDGRSALGFWKKDTPCDLLTGTDGTIYPPFIKKDREIDVFSTDLCRSLTFTFSEESEHRDIPTYRFTVPALELEDPRINEENMCYCLTPTVDECPKAGAMSLEGCRGGAPIMMSTPYFLDGDVGYLEASGLPTPPDRNKHQTFLDIEPNSGVLLRGHKRIQVNIDVKVGTGVNAYANLTEDIVFPLVWADENAAVDQENADELRDKLLKPLKIVDIAKWVILGVGVAIVAVGLAIFVIRRRQSAVTV